MRKNRAIDFSVEESDTGISMTHDSGDDVAGMTVGVIAEESRYMAETRVMLVWVTRCMCLLLMGS